MLDIEIREFTFHALRWIRVRKTPGSTYRGLLGAKGAYA
jgi:hypothetical protein